MKSHFMWSTAGWKPLKKTTKIILSNIPFCCILLKRAHPTAEKKITQIYHYSLAMAEQTEDQNSSKMWEVERDCNDLSTESQKCGHIYHYSVNFCRENSLILIEIQVWNISPRRFRNGFKITNSGTNSPSRLTESCLAREWTVLQTSLHYWQQNKKEISQMWLHLISSAWWNWVNEQQAELNSQISQRTWKLLPSTSV